MASSYVLNKRCSEFLIRCNFLFSRKNSAVTLTKTNISEMAKTERKVLVRSIWNVVGGSQLVKVGKFTR